MSEMDVLKQRIAALEAKLGADEAEEKKEEKDDGKETLASEIASLERQLNASDDDDEDDEDDEDKKEEVKASDDEDKDDEKKEEVTASEVDPNGVEEDITQKSLTEVEGITHGEELTTGPSMGAVAPTRSEYVARMRSASARLDAVAAYLEKHGRRELAFRVDAIADAVDAKIKGGK